MNRDTAAPASKYAEPITMPPLDETLFSLSAEEFEFFEAHTGISNEDEMKQHILDVQKKAYRIYGYPCIRSFSFIKLKISRLPAYQSAMELCRNRNDAILLDIGCCFGNDVRKAVSDGWPIRNVVASDIRQGFWNYGHELFKSTPESFPAAFIAGDAFDPEMVAPLTQLHVEEPKTPIPPLGTLKSLTPLQGRISVIHASSFFHLFDEGRQIEMAQRIASLLSPIPGSIIFGSQLGKPVKGLLQDSYDRHTTLFLHSPDSWCDLWDGRIFDKGIVKVESTLRRIERPGLGGEHVDLLVWSIIKQ